MGESTTKQNKKQRSQTLQNRKPHRRRWKHPWVEWKHCPHHPWVTRTGIWGVVDLSPFYRWEHWGPGKEKDICESKELTSESRVRAQSQLLKERYTELAFIVHYSCTLWGVNWTQSLSVVCRGLFIQVEERQPAPQRVTKEDLQPARASGWLQSASWQNLTFMFSCTDFNGMLCTQ